MDKVVLTVFLITVLTGLYIQVEGQLEDCILKGHICTRNAFDNRPCCNSQGPPCPPNTRVGCRFIRCRERYGQKQWHWYCLHWNYYQVYIQTRGAMPMDDYEAESPGKYIGSSSSNADGGGGGSSRSHKLAELQQEIIEQLVRIVDRLESKVNPKDAAAKDDLAKDTVLPRGTAAKDDIAKDPVKPGGTAAKDDIAKDPVQPGGTAAKDDIATDPELPAT